jgi:hypothetical protein
LRARKSSAHVTLVLLGAATLAGCGSDGDALRRDVYTSREDCAKDWGDEQRCEPIRGSSGASGGSSGSGGGGRGGGWYGPEYRSDGSASHEVRPGSHAVGSSEVSRGGFGSSGAAHGSGG